MNKICIIGVGLIGGSFALGLKNTRKIEIVGFGRNEAHLLPPHHFALYPQ
jgi:prephenate dehydrogenase